MADTDVEIKFGANTSGAEGAIKNLASSLERLSSPIAGVGKALEGLGIGLLVAAAVEAARKITDFAESMGKLGEETERTAAILGITVEEWSKLSFMADVTGASSDRMKMSLEFLGVSMENAASGSKRAQAAFEAAGVSFKDAHGNMRPIVDVFYDLSDAYMKAGDSSAQAAAKVAIARDLMGRAGAEMIPTLDKGAQAIKATADQAKIFGVALSDSMVAKMTETAHGMAKLGEAMLGVGISIFDRIKPAFDAIVKSLTDLVVWFNNSLSRISVFSDEVDILAAAFKGVATVIAVIIAGFQIMNEVGGAVIDSLAHGLQAMTAAVADALQGKWEDIGPHLKEIWGQEVTDFKGSTDRMLGVATSFIDNMKKLWAGGALEVAVHPKIGAGLGDPGNIEAAAAEQAAFAKAWKAYIAKLTADWEGFTTVVVSSFDKAISGLITGTMSFKQAFMSVIGSIAQSFIQMIEKMVAKWLAGELAKTTASITGAHLRTAAEVEAATATGTISLGAIFKTIMADAGKVFGGIFGFLAPVLGPAAAGPAAAGYAAVEAVAGSVPGYDVGSWNLPSDHLAMVHKGEMIVPAAGGMADALREMLQGGGGGGYDGPSANEIAHAMAKQMFPQARMNSNATRALGRSMQDAVRRIAGRGI